eukprot:SAG31_NODE_14240_length_819_cov_0.969444_1_plen_36_part_10
MGSGYYSCKLELLTKSKETRSFPHSEWGKDRVSFDF